MKSGGKVGGLKRLFTRASLSLGSQLNDPLFVFLAVSVVCVVKAEVGDVKKDKNIQMDEDDENTIK